VDARTYLPVRLVLSPKERADFGWLKPTAANLATLRVTVPAGLREVRLPAGATFMWAGSPRRGPVAAPALAVDPDPGPTARRATELPGSRQPVRWPLASSPSRSQPRGWGLPG